MLMWVTEIRRQEPTGWGYWRCGLNDQVGGPAKWTRNKGSFALAPSRLPLHLYRPLGQDLLPAGAEVCSATCSGRSLVGKAAHWLCFSPNTRLTPTFRHSAYHTKTRDTTQCQDTETRAESDHTLASC